MPPCPYKALSVSKTATLSEIKLAYRKLALQLHPDRNGGDPAKSEKFKAVSAAYSILSDPNELRKYKSEQRQQQPWPSHNSGQGFTGEWKRGGHYYRPHAQHGNEYFNEEEFLAYMFGDENDEFDFYGPETVIYNAATGRTHRTSRRSKPKQTKKASKNNKADSFKEFSAEEIENIIRHSTHTARSPMSQRAPKKGSSNMNQGHRSQSPGKSKRKGGKRGKGGNLDSDCIVS